MHGFSEAELKEIGTRFLATMRDWETYDDEGMTNEQSNLVWGAYAERVERLRRELAPIAPKTMAGVHVKLRCMLFDDPLMAGMHSAIADNRLTRKQYDGLEPIQQGIWRLIKDIERMDGRQRQGEGA